MSDTPATISIGTQPEIEISAATAVKDRFLCFSAEPIFGENDWKGSAFYQPSAPYKIRFAEAGEFCYLVFTITGVNNWIFLDKPVKIEADHSITTGAIDVSNYLVTDEGKTLILPVKAVASHKPTAMVINPKTNKPDGEYTVMSFVLSVVDKNDTSHRFDSQDPSMAIGIGRGG